MSAEVHPAATHHLPIFITPPGQTDVLMVVMAGFLLVAVVALGLLFLRLYALPQHIAHRGRRLQGTIVAILCLIALLTQIWGFWVAALLLALTEIPDFGDWMPRIAAALERIAGIEPPSDESHTGAKSDERGADRRDGPSTSSNPMMEGPMCRFRREARARERHRHCNVGQPESA